MKRTAVIVLLVVATGLASGPAPAGPGRRGSIVTGSLAVAEAVESAPHQELALDLEAAAAGGDVPGTDSKILPRPLGSTRVLDEALDGQGSRLRVFSSLAARDDIREEMARALGRRGCAPADAEIDPATLAFACSRDAAFVLARVASREGRSVVSVVEIPVAHAITTTAGANR